MIWLAYILIALLAILLAGQVALVVGYVLRLRRWRPNESSDFSPRAAVILCVRGQDPSLVACVQAVLRQDYDNYHVRIVFDSALDAGYDLVANLIADESPERVSLLVMDQRQPTASLKCNAIIYAANSLSPADEVVALLDADTIPHSTWLRDLVRPFADPEVGATTGIRWYEPPFAEIGTLVRAIWNTAAVVQMYWYQIPWGGSLAIRRQTIESHDLLAKWSTTFCEDTVVGRALNESKTKLAFVPNLHMVNQERCRAIDFFGWVTRQLLTTRLYHQAWPLVVGHGIGTTVTLGLSTLMLLIAILMGKLSVVTPLFLGLVAYEFASLLLLLMIASCGHRLLRQDQRPLESWGGELSVMYLLALPITQLLYGIAIIRSLWVKQIQWRGVTYQIDANRRLQMLDYAPYQQVPATGIEEQSL